MVESPPASKEDEQYPLLSSEVDAARTNTPVAMIAPGWRVPGPPKPSWTSRWPELLSACWMTFILLGISFLVFYLVGMSAYRRQQQLVIVKDIPSKPASNVFFHQIVSRGTYLSFLMYSDYLSTLAQQYPELKFNVYFLKEDSLSGGHRDPKQQIFKKLMPYNPIDEYRARLDDENKRMAMDFQLRFPNVNISISSLSTYMSSTPLKFKWRKIPLFYLPFYARVSAIWQYGGIGLDLGKFNLQHLNNKLIDKRMAAIFKQHNEGINSEEYGKMLNTITDKEEENNFENMFTLLLDSILNQSQNLFNYSKPFPNEVSSLKPNANKKLVRTHRSKREVLETENLKNTTEIINKSIDNDNVTIPADLSTNTSSELINDKTNITKIWELSNVINNGSNFTAPALEADQRNISKPDFSKVLFYYDFSIFSNGIGPSYVSESRSDLEKTRIKKNRSKRRGPDEYLTIDSEGTFIAASSRHHSFLGHLLAFADLKFHPRCAIRDAFTSQCSGVYKDDNYCNNIFML